MSEKHDGAEVLSKISGLGRAEVLSIWEQVKANQARVNSCARHKFSGERVRLGQKMTCENCGGTMSLTDIGKYISGYEAAGKSCDDIWLGYRATKATPAQTKEDQSE